MNDPELFCYCFDLLSSPDTLPFRADELDKNGVVRGLDSTIFNMLIGKNASRFFNILQDSPKISNLLLSSDPANPLRRVPFPEHVYRLMIRSVFVGTPEFTDKLLTLLVEEFGVSVDHQDGLGNTPLHCGGLCCYDDSAEILLQLLKRGARLDIRNANGLNAVEYWAEVCGLGELVILVTGLVKFAAIDPNFELASVTLDPTHAIVALSCLSTSPDAPEGGVQKWEPDFASEKEYLEAEKTSMEEYPIMLSWLRPFVEQVSDLCTLFVAWRSQFSNCLVCSYQLSGSLAAHYSLLHV